MGSESMAHEAEGRMESTIDSEAMRPIQLVGQKYREEKK